jgi:hypothetical protein
MQSVKIWKKAAPMTAVLAGLFILATSCLAANKKFDVYSWAEGSTANEWCFALLPSSDQTPDAAAIKNAEYKTCGRHDVKRLMGQTFPEGSKVTWKTNPTAGFVLPPMDIVNDLKRFAVSMDFKLQVSK